MLTDTVNIERNEKLTKERFICTFTTVSRRYVITAEISANESKNVAPYLTVDLEPIGPTSKGLSICGDVYEKRGGRWVDVGGGQCTEGLRQDFPNDATVARLCEIWDAYHLCDMQAGTRAQRAVIDAWKAAGYPGSDTPGRYDYSCACLILENAGVLDVPIPEDARANFGYRRDEDGNLPTHYRYGSAWLCGSIPADIEAEVRALMTPSKPTPSPEEENRAQLKRRGISMVVMGADRNPNMPDSRNMNHYKCVFSRGRRRMTVYFSKGLGLHGQPTINEVWDTITEDAASIEGQDFSEFCSNYGYDEDSRKAERTFKACQHSAARLANFLEGGR